MDYCLRIGQKETVFIEVKKSNEDLDQHQEQLLKYAFEGGVECAILTNGLLWWLYLPLLKGSWQERKFLAIDIRQQEVDAAAHHFRKFLSRDAIASGTAVSDAKALHASKEKKRQIGDKIAPAWIQLCEEPDELLVELLAEKVESMCGHKPEADYCAAFLRRAVSSSPPEPPQPPGEGRGGITPQGAYREPILRCLSKLGGRGRAPEVVDRVGELMEPRLTSEDREPLKSGDIRWKKNAQWARFRLGEEGLLKKDSPRGTWELTEKGRRVAERLKGP